MLTQGVVGPQSAQSLPPGANVTTRQGNMGELIASELHGPYYEGTYRKTRFGGANQAAVTTTAAFTTTYTGLILANPSNSPVNLVLEKVGFASILAQTSPLAVGLMTGQSTTALSGSLTSVAPKSKFVGSGVPPVGQLYSAVTLPVAPTLDTVLGVIDTGAVTVATSGQGLFDLQGSIVIPPGGFVALYTNVASVAASLFASMQWEEVPV
jgi:hypothetical protein